MAKKPTKAPTGKARLEQIEAKTLAAGKRTSVRPKSRLDEVESQAQRAMRSGQRESDDAEGDDEE